MKGKLSLVYPFSLTSSVASLNFKGIVFNRLSTVQSVKPDILAIKMHKELLKL